MSLILLVCSKSHKQDVALEINPPKELLRQQRLAEGEQGCRRVEFGVLWSRLHLK
jgi:hypothetical protein